MSVKPPLKIIKEFLPLTKTYGNTGRPIGITLHQTGAPGSGKNARWMANYQRSMASPSNFEQKSWHFQVDDTLAIQSFAYEVGCWAASDGSGPGNYSTVQIESCINSDGDYEKCIHNTAKLMAWICYELNFNPYKQIYTHYHWSTKAGRSKWCPAQILNGKQGWTLSKVIDLTAKYLNQLKDAKNDYNPQGLATKSVSKYKAPDVPFKELKVGDTVTLTKGFLWYDPSNKQQLVSNRQKELEGTSDEIAEVLDIDDVNFSKVAYKLKKYNSWILEEYLEEVKAGWKQIDKTTQEDGKEGINLKEGQFVWKEKLYQIEEVK